MITKFCSHSDTSDTSKQPKLNVTGIVKKNMKDIKDKKMTKPCLNCDLNPPTCSQGMGLNSTVFCRMNINLYFKDVKCNFNMSKVVFI